MSLMAKHIVGRKRCTHPQRLLTGWRACFSDHLQTNGVLFLSLLFPTVTITQVASIYGALDPGPGSVRGVFCGSAQGSLPTSPRKEQIFSPFPG